MKWNTLKQKGNAARFINNKPYNPERPDSVTSMIQEMKWNTLEQRRIWTDVTLMHKVVNQLIAVPTAYQPELATVRGTRSSHYMQFVLHQCRINVYQHSLFSPNSLVYRNTLPESVTCCHHRLQAFTPHLLGTTVTPTVYICHGLTV